MGAYIKTLDKFYANYWLLELRENGVIFQS